MNGDCKVGEIRKIYRSGGQMGLAGLEGFRGQDGGGNPRRKNTQT